MALFPEQIEVEPLTGPDDEPTGDDVAELLAQARVADLADVGPVYTGDNDDVVRDWMDQHCGSADKLPHVIDNGDWLEFWSNGRWNHMHPGDRPALDADGWFTVEVPR